MSSRFYPAMARVVNAGTQRPRLAPSSRVIHLAIIHGPDGVEFATAARSQSALIRRVLAYVRPAVSDKLWPTDADRFARLAADGEHRAAVELYFSTVGQRWDDEKLWIGATTDTDDGAPR